MLKIFGDMVTFAQIPAFVRWAINKKSLGF